MSQRFDLFSDFNIKNDAVMIGYLLLLVSLALELLVNECRTIALMSLFVSLYFSSNLRRLIVKPSLLKISLFFPLIAALAWFYGPFGSDGLKTFDWFFCLAIATAAAVSRPRESVILLSIIPLAVLLASIFTYLQYLFGFVQFEDLFIKTARLRLYNLSTNRMGLTFAFSFAVCCGLVSLKKNCSKYAASLLPIFVYLCWLTQSRSAFFAVVGVAIIFLLFNIRFYSVKIKLLVLLAVFFVAVGGLAFFDNNRIIRTLTSGSLDYLLSGREDIWRAAWEIFQKSPIFGFGIDSFHDTLSAHLAIPGNAERFPGLPVPNIFWNAHQIVLGILAEMGLAGLAIFIYLVIRGLRMGFACSPETLAPLFILIAYLIAGIGGYGFHRSWNSAFFFLSLGLIEGVYMNRDVLHQKHAS